jgi:DNA-binding IclR family transcriptional regulator
MTMELERTRTGATPAYQISSVDRALSLLTLIGERSQVLVSEAAAFLGTSPSTAHRILQMLVLHGYVVQGEHRAYRRGPAMASLSDGVPAPRDLVALAKPHVSRLRDQLAGTVHLVTLEGNGARFVAGAQPSQLSSPARVRPGWLLPAHVVAGGKALLAEMSTESLTLLYPGGVPITRHGRIHSLSHLKRELADVRRAGYARSVGEAIDDVAAVAVALPWIPGVPRFSLSIGWCDATRLLEDEAVIVHRLREAAEEFAADLGAPAISRAS